MASNIVNKVPYLRTSREFPEELRQLAFECNKAYIDVANTVNNRTISIFPVNKPAINGESWFITKNQRQQGLREVYIFTTFAASLNIPHGLNFSSIDRFTKPQGSFTDGTNYYGAIYASNVPIIGQVSFYIDPVNIVVLREATAPVIVNGIIVLEWISQP